MSQTGTLHHSVELEPSFAQLLWCCAFDDDDCASELLNFAIVHIAQEVMGKQLANISVQRAARYEVLLGECRSIAITRRDHYAKRLADYAKAEREEMDIPF